MLDESSTTTRKQTPKNADIAVGKTIKGQFLVATLCAFASLSPAEVRSQGSINNPVVQLVKQHLGSVGTVITLDRNSQPQALGSGFFIDSKGSLVTNAHVIEGAKSVVIRWRSQTNQALRVGRFDNRYDLAVLETGYTNTPSIPLGDSDAVLVGEEIVALGNPQGLEGTVSTGIVSGIREITNGRFLQITAPISPGSSGGPILNTGGKVIGIATASLSIGQNLNFAVPVNLLKSLSRVDLRFEAVKAPSTEARDMNTWKDLVRPTNVIESINCRSLNNVVFSIQNDSSHTIKGLKALLVARNSEGQPLDYKFQDLAEYGPIPPGLAKQVNIHFFVRGYTNDCLSNTGPKDGIEIRILTFEVVREASLETLFKGR